MITIDFEVTQGDGSTGSNHNVGNTYIVQVKKRDKVELLAEYTFSYDVSALTQFEVSRLDTGNEDSEARFGKLKEFGSRLYRTLFNESIELVWKAYKEQNDFVVMCLRIHPKAKQLEILPWETLYDGTEFIAAGSCTGFNRLPLDIAPINDLAPLPKPLKMLALLSSPLDLEGNERLLIEKEQEILLRGVNRPAGLGKLQVDFEDEAQLPVIENSLETPYPIFHYSGHGGIDSHKKGGLLLEDIDGNKRFTPVDEVIQTLHKGLRHFRLAVIAGCQTAKTLYASQFSDLGRALVRKGVPAVIAMQFSITDEGGLMLAETLYPKLAEGQSLEKALNATRRKMLQSEQPHIQADALAAVSFIAGQDVLKTIDTPKESSYEDIQIDFGGTLTIPRLNFQFYGRRKEYRIIRDGILKNNERVIIVHGIGGIGKTSLVGHVIDRLGKNYKGVCFIDCHMGILSPDMVLLQVHRELESKGIDVLKQVMNRCLSPEQLGGVMGQVLSQVPVLVVFDNFETQLKSLAEDNEAPITEVLPGSRGGFFKTSPWEIRDENLKTFLEVLVKTTAQSSCYLFTTRYVFEIDERRVGMVRLLPLHDLNRIEALGLMQHLPNLSQSSYEDKKEAYRVFGGHPYGIVTLDKYCSYKSLGEVLKDTGSIQKELREFLAIELSYEKLTVRAKELLNRFAAFREPMAWDAILWMMKDKEQIVNGLDGLVKELIDWGLIIPVRESEVMYLTVHSLVREFCKEQCGEKWKGYLKEAAAFYSNRFEHIDKSKKTLTTVLGEVEGAELLMEAGEYENAVIIITNIDPLLDRWGLGQLLELLYNWLLKKVKKENHANILHNMAVLMQKQGNYTRALAHYEQSLKIREELGDYTGMGMSFNNIGAIYQFKGEYEKALAIYEKSLKIFEEDSDRAGMAMSLHQTGIIYHKKGDFERALTLYKQSLKIKEEIGNREGVAFSLHQIGMLYQHLFNFDEALVHYKKSKKIFEELSNREGIAMALHQLGIIYQFKGNNDNALANYELSLRIKEEIGDRSGLAVTHGQLGLLFEQNRNFPGALEHFLIALSIFIQLQSPDAQKIVENLILLRDAWGAEAFDQAWLEKTGEPVPDFLTTDLVP